MTDQQALFGLPGEVKEAPNLSDLEGKLMLIRPTSTKTVDTSFGPSDVTIAHVVAIADNGDLINLPETFVFWKGVTGQLAPEVGTGRWVAGVLRQGAGRNSKAWSLATPTTGEQSRLAGVMASAEFLKLVDDANGEPF